MNAPAPRLAIVTACYQHAHYLAECMASVRAQTCPAWEHVVVIDGATDQSEAVARAEAAKDARVTVLVHPENRGLAAAHNTGVRATSAPWLLKVDADDTIAPAYVERILAVAEGPEPRPNVVFSWARVFDGPGRPFVYRYPRFNPAGMIERLMIPGPAAYRRELWEGVGGQDESLRGAEDWDFWIRAELAVGLRVHQIPAPLWNYRDHVGPRVSREAVKRLPEYQERWRRFVSEREAVAALERAH